MCVWNFQYAALVFIILSKEKIYFANISIGYVYINIFIFILFTSEKKYLMDKSFPCIANRKFQSLVRMPETLCK